MKYIIYGAIAIGLVASSTESAAQSAGSNRVYIDQVGSNSNIAVTQAGSGNELGNPTTAASFGGSSQVVTITQIGANNTGNFNIQGSSASITSNVTGNLNTVSVSCGAAATTSCNDTTIEANATGDTNTVNIVSGAKTISKINVIGDNNTSSISSTTTNLLGSKADVKVTGGLNAVSVTQSGPGGGNGFDTNVEVSGASNTIGVTQSGTVDSTVNIKSVGANNTITVLSGN